MKDFAIPSVGKDVVLIKNNKVIAKGRSRSSMGYVIGIELQEGPLYDELCKAKIVSETTIPVKYINPRFSQVTGEYIHSGFNDGEEIDGLMEDVMVVDLFNLVWGMVPDSFSSMLEYRWRQKESLGYQLNEFPMTPYFIQQFYLEKEQLENTDA